MSFIPREQFNYIREVEAYFLHLAGRGVMLSSRDVELVRAWRDQGAPVEVVCRGILDAFDAKDNVRSVAQCRKAVEAEVEAWRGREAGAHGPPPSPSTAQIASPRAPSQAYGAHFVERIMALGQDADEPWKQTHYRWAYAQMRELYVQAKRAKRPLELNAVADLELALFDRVAAALPEEVQPTFDRAMATVLRQRPEGASRRPELARRILFEQLGFRGFYLFHVEL